MKGPQDVDAYLSPRARRDIADAIAETGGNEVFFVGSPGDDGRVDVVEVHCRGHASAVPALKQAGRWGDAVIHNHPSGRLVPSEPDVELASHYGQEGIGFYIVDNEASAIYVVVERPRDTTRDVDLDAVDAAFRGGLPQALGGYEARDGQVLMARAVAEGGNEHRVTVVEAGTGTGKSLAYLVPSAMRALGTGERVVVATRTRHLQQQLVDADVPVVRRLLPDLRVAVLKGRGNYLCRRKLQDRLAEEDGDEAERDFLRQVRDWADVTRHGDLDDLPFVPDRELWELVQSTTEHTLRVRCPHYDRCFYYSSRRGSSQAQIIVANHHLLLADRSLRMDGVAAGLMPRYEHVVLDEAHHLEDVATSFSGERVSAVGLLRLLGRLRPTRGKRKGLAVRLRAAAVDSDADEATGLQVALERLLQEVEACRATLRLELEDVAAGVLEVAPKPEGNAPVVYRLTDDLEQAQPVLHTLLRERLDALAGLLSDLASNTESVLTAFGNMPERFQRKHLQLRLDLQTVQRRLVENASAVAAILAANPELVRWVEFRRPRDEAPQPTFHVRPIEAQEVVRRLLLENVRSLTLTSATMTVGGTFEHFLERTGLDRAERLHTELIESPFDYGQQVYVGVPQDLPEPSSRDYEAGVVQAVTEAIRIAEGRSFVLFTSYRMLHRVADRVRGRLGRGWSILRQGELPRERLLEVFKARQRAALFGTDSFWEGVDVRGEALSAVILPRLPFRVPSEPVQVARAERLAERGGDPFGDLAVPQAVLKFRQGFGRLVRSRSDRGVVLVLDTRIVRKGYGRAFLRSLPPGVQADVAPLPDVLARMAGFLNRRG